jgi:uncharacterized protein
MKQPEQESKELPFNNLFLNSGIVNGYNQWWMYLATILMTLFGYLVLSNILFVPLFMKLMENGYSMQDLANDSHIIFDSEKTGVDKNLILLAQFGIFVLATIGFLIGLKKFHKKALTSVLTGYEKFRFRRFWTAFAIWGILLILVVLLNYVIDPEGVVINIEPQGFIVSILLCFIFMPIQTGIEEVFFRGYLMQGFSQIFKNGIGPLIITSFLFGAVHMSNPEVRQYGWGIMLSYYVLFALFMGALTLLDEGLELAIGIHFANNFFSSALVTSPHSVIKTYSVFTVSADDPAAEIVLWLCMATVTFTIFWLIYRWKNFNLILK